MVEVGIKELKNTTSKVIDDVSNGEKVIVTKSGKPTAVILSMVEAEDYILAHADEYVRLRLGGRSDYRSGKSIPLEDL